METCAVVNKAQTKKKNDPDKHNPMVIPENDPDQDPYTVPTPRDNTYDVSKLDQYQQVKLFLTKTTSCLKYRPIFMLQNY